MKNFSGIKFSKKTEIFYKFIGDQLMLLRGYNTKLTIIQNAPISENRDELGQDLITSRVSRDWEKSRFKDIKRVSSDWIKGDSLLKEYMLLFEIEELEFKKLEITKKNNKQFRPMEYHDSILESSSIYQWRQRDLDNQLTLHKSIRASNRANLDL